MTTQVMGTMFRYSHTIGRSSAGPGFKSPVAIVRGEEDRIYVINRGQEYRTDALRVTMFTPGEEYLGEFGSGNLEGEDSSTLVWPTYIALDKEGKVYIVDEWLNRICVYSGDGEPITRWGVAGSGDGEFDRPAGIAFDANDNLYVVDSCNNRIQKFTKDGKFLAKWGEAGTGDGQFNLPWGIDIDHAGNVYVADWRNDRIQKFTPDGQFLMKFGASGSGDGEFNRPTDVAVDKDGTIYVADWGNHRLQVFNREGRFITKMTGDATVSKWAKQQLDANPDMWQQREIAQGMEREKLFWYPIAVEVDEEGQVFVVETARDRIQVYRKLPPVFVGQYDGGRL